MTFPLLFACFMGIFFAFSRSPLMSLFRIIDSISRGKLRWDYTKYISVIKTLIHLDHLWEASFIHSKTH